MIVIQKSTSSRYGIIHYLHKPIPYNGYEVLEIYPSNTAMPMKSFKKEITEAIKIDLGESIIEKLLNQDNEEKTRLRDRGIDTGTESADLPVAQSTHRSDT